MPSEVSGKDSWPGRPGTLLIGVLLGVALPLAGCSREPVPEAETLAEPPPSVVKVAEFVICIDNSASIPPPVRILIRESVMLLADLVEEGDRLSVIAFDEHSRLVTTRRVVTDEDRRRFKKDVGEGLDFRGQRSDIRAGVQLLAEKRGELFPSPSAHRAAVFFSDGLLETTDRRHADAYAQMQALLRDQLSDLDRYAVLLGDTSSRQTISGLSVTGAELMRNSVASSFANFFHAIELDQLLDVAVMILKKTKGISSLGDEAGTTYRIDRTVEAMTLIVRKKTSAGVDLASSEEIELAPPRVEEAAGERIRRSTDYTYFDLFVVTNPRQGNWRITLKSGAAPRVLSKIDSPIQLTAAIRPDYYLNETVPLAAWLVDERTSRISRDTYELQARITSGAGPERYVPLQPDPDRGQYLLDAPSDLFPDGTPPGGPREIKIEIIAQRRADPHASDLDPWFVRRSAPTLVRITEPLVTWVEQEEVSWRWPIQVASLTFGGQILIEQYSKVEFDTPPSLTVEVQLFDEDEGLYKALRALTVSAERRNAQFVFQAPIPLDQNGGYRYRYQLAGNTSHGPVQIDSHWMPFRVEYPWLPMGLATLLFVAMLDLLAALTAKLKGTVRVEISDSPGSSSGHGSEYLMTISTPPSRRFDSRAIWDKLRHKLGDKDRTAQILGDPPGDTHFIVRARRHLIFFKRFRVLSQSGTVTVEGRGRVGIQEGDSRSYPMNLKPTITFTTRDNRTVMVKLRLH